MPTSRIRRNGIAPLPRFRLETGLRAMEQALPSITAGSSSSTWIEWITGPHYAVALAHADDRERERVDRGDTLLQHLGGAEQVRTYANRSETDRSWTSAIDRPADLLLGEH